MPLGLSILMITKNCDDVVGKSLESVKNLADEIVVVDDFSTDSTVEIAKKHGTKVYSHHEEDFGKQRQYALSKISNEWVLVLDSDEMVTEELRQEIIQLFSQENKGLMDSYKIKFQGRLFGKPLKYGGEVYEKLVLFKKDKAVINPSLIHEKFEIEFGKIGRLKNTIIHDSYRSLGQLLGKFTDYAKREAKRKTSQGEKTSLWKLLAYPAHMFYARFIKDQGYKDGIIRLPLDIGFAYMEFATYLLMFFVNHNSIHRSIESRKI